MHTPRHQSGWGAAGFTVFSVWFQFSLVQYFILIVVLLPFRMRMFNACNYRLESCDILFDFT